jgi:hypothetical protein
MVAELSVPQKWSAAINLKRNPMAKITRLVPWAVLTLFACTPAGVPLAGPGNGVQSGAPVSSGTATESSGSATVPFAPTPRVTGSISVTASVSSIAPEAEASLMQRYGMYVTADGNLAPAVGSTVTLRTRSRSDGSPVKATQWSLDEVDTARASLTPSADGATCKVEIHQAGALRVTAQKDFAQSRIVLVAVSSPAPGKLLALNMPGSSTSGSYYGGFLFPNMPVVITSAADWNRYWQGIAAYTDKLNNFINDRPIPLLPLIDLTTSSLVIIGETSGTAGPYPVLARVDASGQGLVEIGRPQKEQSASSTTGGAFLQIFQVAKLPATTRVLVDCRSEFGCASPQPLPSPDPIAVLSAQALVVGQAIDLPAQVQGVPLTWGLGARTAARAKLDGLHLVPTLPGGLVLTVSDGVQSALVLDAVSTAIDLERPLSFQSGQPHATLDGGPQLVRTVSAWTSLWNKLWYPVGTGANQPWTGPPPPPAPPAVEFPARNVLAVSITTSVKPIVTSIDSTTLTLVVPGIVRSGVFTPMGSAAGPTYFYDLPARENTPTVALEPFPEIAAPAQAL